MPYSRLLADRKIHHEPAAKAQVGDQLAAARRDLATAQRFGANEVWSYNIADNAMLLAGRAVMFSEGYRPTSGEGGHTAVIEFLRLRIGPGFGPLLDLMDRMRRQRHRIAYEAVGVVSENQIVEALKTAQKFVHNMERLLGHGASPEDSTPPAPRRS
jgi:uncharacterized protein (UPF0332 family)